MNLYSKMYAAAHDLRGMFLLQIMVSGVASNQYRGKGGQSAPLTAKKNCQKLGIREENQEKIGEKGKIGMKRQKSGRF